MESTTLMDQNAALETDPFTTPAPANGRHRSTGRLPLLMPVVIKGIDATGHSFIEHSHTLLVNKAGFKTVSKQALARGNRIQIAVPSRQRVSWATIAWLGEKNADGQEVGIALEQIPDDFWGVEFPPAASTQAGREHENGTAPVRTGSRNGRPGSDKLSGALQELAQLAIEEALERALKNFQARAEETQSQQAAQFAAQLQDRVEQALSAARERLDAQLGKMDAQLGEMLASRRRDWERSLESLGDAAGERMRSRIAEQERLMGTRAEKVCRDLSDRLSAASRLLADSQELPE